MSHKSEKRALKRGSEAWKKQQLERYLKSVNKDVSYDDEALTMLNKEMELLKATQDSIKNREKNNPLDKN